MVTISQKILDLTLLVGIILEIFAYLKVTSIKKAPCGNRGLLIFLSKFNLKVSTPNVRNYNERLDDMT